MNYLRYCVCLVLLIGVVNLTKVPTVKLNNGLEIPILGLGTWKSKPGEVKQAVKDAIDLGYRHIDGAWMYRNEKEVGEAIRDKIQEGVVKREDLFVVSKLWNSFHKPENVEPALNESLNALGLDYVDLYLMHSPVDFKSGDDPFALDANGKVLDDGVDYVDTWKALEKIYHKGLARSIGISNFNKRQVERILETGSVVPVTNQVECHPYLNQKKLAEFCKSKNITLTAYSPFGSPDRPWAKPGDPKLLDDPKLKTIAEKYTKTPAQVVLRYLVQQGFITIPKSVHKNRIQENIDIFDFQLSPEDMQYIDSFDRGPRGRIVPFDWADNHRFFPFNDEY